MFHMINKRALLLEVWCTLIILNFYLFQKNFTNLRGPKWVLFRLKRFLLEALSTNDFIRTLIVKDNVCGRIFFRWESTTKTSHMLASGLRRRLCVVLIKCSIGWLKLWPAERSVFLMRYFSHSDRMRLLCVCANVTVRPLPGRVRFWQWFRWICELSLCCRIYLA